MKQKLIGSLALALLVAMLAGRTEGQGAANPLVGKWTLVSVEEDGKPAKVEAGTIVTITATEIKIGKEGAGYTYKIDSAKKPMHIDLSVEKLRILGIFELKDDNLKICLGDPNSGVRATAFQTQAKTANDTLMVFRRSK